MQIQGVGTQQAWQVFKAKQEGAINAADNTRNPQSAVQASTETPAAEVSPDKGQAQGVLRLLSEGHFNGVADLRLRINFHEELQLMSSREAGEVVESGGQELVTTLDTKIQAIGDTFAFTDQQVEGLVQNFEEKVDPFITGTKEGPFNYSAALSGIREAFSGLLGGLEALAPASAEASPVVEETKTAVVPDVVIAGGEPVATADASEVGGGDSAAATGDFTLALQGLEEWFKSEMDSLEKAVTDSLSSPPLSEARGKGVAYNRFLDIYNGLSSGAATTGEESGNTDVTGVQTIA